MASLDEDRVESDERIARSDDDSDLAEKSTNQISSESELSCSVSIADTSGARGEEEKPSRSVFMQEDLTGGSQSASGNSIAERRNLWERFVSFISGGYFGAAPVAAAAKEEPWPVRMPHPETFTVDKSNKHIVFVSHVKDECKLAKILSGWRNAEAVSEVCVIDSQSLEAVPVELGRFKHTTKVCFSSDALSEFPWQVLLLRQLTELDLSDNIKLRELPRTIGHCSRLKVLDISHCNVAYLPTEMINLTQLHTLKAEGNPHMSPPLHIMESGVTSIMNFLRKRWDELENRHDLWARSTAWGGDGQMDERLVCSLQDITLRYILDFHPDLLMRTVLPIGMKRFLLRQQEARRHDLRVLKCSKCKNYFTNQSIFEMHFCIEKN